MIRFSETAEAIRAEPGKNGKVALLASYLSSLADGDLAAATLFFTGAGAGAGKRLAIGYRTIVAAAESVWQVGPNDLRASYRTHGDLGDALGPFVRPPLDLGLFRETLTPARLAELLDAAADAKGPRAGTRRTAICATILGSCSTASEATYAIKILSGELRIGLAEGLVVDAVAAAFARDIAAVRRAFMASGDLGAVAVAAKRDELAAIAVRYFRPIGFMLASPVAFGSSYKELAEAGWYVEDKFDGIRAQVHVRGGEARIYSRTFADITASFPDVRAVAERSANDMILDGEIIARRDGRPLPFRSLQPRLQRKDPPPALVADIPAAFVAFDVLASGDRLLIDDALSLRRAELERIRSSPESLQISEATTLARGDAGAVTDLFEEARARGNEGLVLKRDDSPYLPGRRGKWWLKIKRELATLDVVVVAVEWGHGKRKHVLSDYTFAVRGADGETLVAIGKAYTGLTDAEIAERTAWFLAHTRSPHMARKLVVEPTLVIEVAFDIVQKSKLHASGYALRFPRIVRLRPDKLASEADTINDVDRVYAEMLAREGLTE